MEIHFRVLGVSVTLAGPEPILRPVGSAYRRFIRPDTGPAESIRVALETTDSTEIHVDGRRLPVSEDLDLTLQLYQQFLIAVFDRVESHAIVHAAALTDADGGVFLLAGPTGHGKSSLTLELARRGRGLLSDDYAPLDLATGEISPYPRTVGIAPGDRRLLAETFRAAADDPDVSRLFGKVQLDVGEVLGESCLVREPALLRRVIILDGGDGGDGATSSLTRVATTGDAAERVERELAALDGVEILSRQPRGRLCALTVRVLHDSVSLPLLSRVLDGDGVLMHSRLSESVPDFSRPPRLSPLRRREAATHLGREMLNRRESGRLLARFGGNLAELFVELTVALRDCECSRLSVGRFEETVDLLEELVGP